MVLTREIREAIEDEMRKGNKIQLEYNPKTQEVKILRLTLKKLKVDKCIDEE